MKLRRSDGGAPPPADPTAGAAVGPSTLRVSHARLSRFEQCPRAYRYRYVDDRPERTRSAEAVVGDAVHEVLRRLYAHVGAYGAVPPLEAVLARARATFDELWTPDVQIIARGMTRELYAANAERFVANYYARNAPFDEPTFMLEGHLSAPVGQVGDRRVVAFGYADRISSPRGAEPWRVHDYKTGKRVTSQADADADRQLATYHLGLEATRAVAPGAEVELVWHHVAYGVEVRSRSGPERLAALRHAVLELVGQIEAERHWPARPSPLCAWCDFRAICPDAKR